MGPTLWRDIGLADSVLLLLFATAIIGPYAYALKRDVSLALATVLSIVLTYFVQWIGIVLWLTTGWVEPIEGLLMAEPLIQASPAHWHRFLTSAWLHAPSDPSHLLGNAVIIGLAGIPLEQRLGKGRWTVVYLLGALGGSAFWMVAHLGQSAPALGASGAVFGILGAYLAAWPNDEIEMPLILIRRWPVWLIALLRFGWEIVQVGMIQGGLANPSGIANLAHIGGFLLAYAIGRPLARGGPVPPGTRDSGPSAASAEEAKRKAIKDRMGSLQEDPWSNVEIPKEVQRTLTRLREEGDEPETREAWLDRLSQQATCPSCDSKIELEIERGAPRLVCSNERSHLCWP